MLCIYIDNTRGTLRFEYNTYITGLLEAYVEEQKTKDAEVAKQMPRVIERITNEIIKSEVEEETVDNSHIADKNSFTNTTARGDNVDNRRVRKSAADHAGKTGVDREGNPGDVGNAQENQKWGDLDTKVRGRVRNS